jgi:hypothetical protein
MSQRPAADPEHRQPAYGPGGYLPERAARRARKIVLREQMSAGWPLAALLAAVVLVVAGGMFVLTRTGAPRPPFEPVAELAEVAPRSTVRVDSDGAGPLLLAHSGSALRALGAPATDVVLCAASGHLEGADGSVWRVTGQRLGGTAGSLASYPVRVHAGTVYVDTADPRPPPVPTGTGQAPACG